MKAVKGSDPDKAVMLDAAASGGRVETNDGEAYIIAVGDEHRCMFASPAIGARYIKEKRLAGNVCILGAPADAARLMGLDAQPFKTLAYLKPMPPEPSAPSGVEIKRLAPSLAPSVAAMLGESESGAEELIRASGVFGAICGGALAGITCRYARGDMRRPVVFEKFKDKGIEQALVRFLVMYIMTFGKTPYIFVDASDEQAIAEYTSIGFTQSNNYTFRCRL